MGFTTLILTIDSVAVSSDQIHGAINISRRENEATTMDVTLLTPAGLQDLDSWAGKDIDLVIDGVTAFTGVIDMPEIDVIYKKITLVCTDRRKEILNDQNISTVGFYSSAIFDETENTIEELEQRLQTIPSAADIKPDGVYAITDINPKTVADFSLVDADVYRRKPEVSPASRLRLTNQINLNFKYRYTRLRHREREFKIEDLSFCDILDLGAFGSFTLKKTFINYSNQMDWLLDENSVVWEEMPETTGSTSPPCNIDLAYIHDDRFATSMTYNSAKRFAQTITEEFQITVKAPQSITQYGLIDWNQDNGIESEYDVSDWENFEVYSTPTGGIDDANDYYIDQDNADFTDAVETALNIANTKIIKSHRDTQVNFETDLRLDFNLTHTIDLNTAILDAKGKVTALNHFIDITNKRGNTTTEISLSTAQGVQIPDSLTAPARPSVSVNADAWTSPQVMPIATGTVDSPAIDDTSREEQIEIVTQTYNIEIQNDTFGVTF